MKKILTGAVCAAAIAAAAVVLLPVAAVKIAVGLSKPRDRARKPRTRASRDSNDRFLTDSLVEPERLTPSSPGER